MTVNNVSRVEEMRVDEPSDKSNLKFLKSTPDNGLPSDGPPHEGVDPGVGVGNVAVSISRHLWKTGFWACCQSRAEGAWAENYGAEIYRVEGWG